MGGWGWGWGSESGTGENTCAITAPAVIAATGAGAVTGTGAVTTRTSAVTEGGAVIGFRADWPLCLGARISVCISIRECTRAFVHTCARVRLWSEHDPC